ncbi:hypothetical protein GCM10010869_37480 [Mesorhizobium tianshanense]|nr:hypothetical protein GCM10010869_37480 [Mesorhizobium tianshanense]
MPAADGKRGLITLRLTNDGLDALVVDMREIAVAGRLEPFRHFHLKSLSKPVCVLQSAFTVIAMRLPHSVDGMSRRKRGGADPRMRIRVDPARSAALAARRKDGETDFRLAGANEAAAGTAPHLAETVRITTSRSAPDSGSQTSPRRPLI